MYNNNSYAVNVVKIPISMVHTLKRKQDEHTITDVYLWVYALCPLAFLYSILYLEYGHICIVCKANVIHCLEKSTPGKLYI